MRTEFRAVRGVLAAALIACAAGAFGPHPAAAAVAPEDPAADAALDPAGGLIERIERRLIDMGLFRGPADGRLTDALRDAIRAYQRLSGRDETGLPSNDLLKALEAHGDVQDLIGRLADARRRSIEEARSALSEHPATRDLLAGDEAFRADPTRDPDVCFNAPTARCLLEEAEIAARTVFKVELRDWALGEVLVAQAQSGMAEAARRTASYMTDPRLIMSALRDIAVGQADAGDAEGAVAVADIIPDAERRADALMAVIDSLIRTGRGDTAADAADRLTRLIDTLPAGVKAVDLRARLAVALDRTGRGGDARDQIETAERIAREDTAETERDGALRSVAGALADLHLTERALALLDQTAADTGRAPVLMSAAAAQAEAGDAAAALATAETITEVRYRAVVLGRIALSQFAQGDADAARTTLDLARAGVTAIRLPYARSFAMSRVALALTALSDGSDGDAAGRDTAAAIDLADRIDDARLRAQTLWTIAYRRAEADPEAADRARARAEAATAEIRSALSQAWMFADLASDRAEAGDGDGAWTAFDSAMAAARGIDNAWGRARALARTAAALIAVVESGAPR
jgi:hypothetical protein